MPRKPNATNNLLLRKKLAGQYATSNSVLISDVFKMDTRKFQFICEGCQAEFSVFPSQIKGKFELVYCPACDKKKIRHQCFLKMQEKIKSNPGRALVKSNPDLAKSWIKSIDADFEYSPSNVTCQSSIMVLWRCAVIVFHEWEQRVDSRVNFPRCPYCCKQRIHILESLYSVLEQKTLLNHLHNDDKEKAKALSAGSTCVKLRFFCKICSNLYEAYPHNFLNQECCSSCFISKGTKTRNQNSIKSKGSVATNANLLKQYCYNQKYIDRDKKNKISPEELPISSTKPVWWICHRGHYTKASPSNRNKGKICAKCSNNTSLLEIILFKELSKQFSKIRTDFRVIYNDQKNEIDIALTALKCAIEIDGFQYHKNRIDSDIQKIADVKGLGYEFFIRIRDSRLKPLENCDNISFDKDLVSYQSIFTTKCSKKRQKSHDHICLILNSICSIVDIKDIKFEELKYLEEARETWLETRQVKEIDSVATKFPELLEDFDIDNNPPDLLKKITVGSSVQVNWKCKTCSHKWRTSVSKRAKEKTGCPAEAGQTVTEKNAVGNIHPKIKPAFVDANDALKYTCGSGQRVLFRCTHPGCNANPKEFAIKDVVRRYLRSKTTEFKTCNHFVAKK